MLFFSCTVVKTQHHITLDHNITIKIEKEVNSFLDDLMMKKLLTKYSETMKNRLFSYLFFLFLFTPLVWADYTDRMKARLPDVLYAKDAGTVGEGVDGFLHLRNPVIQKQRNW